MANKNPGFQSEQQERASDISGYRIYSDGDLGEAHIMAHQMLDQGRIAEGHQWLGEWLKGRTGEGSKWVHLQFHMAVFEIEVGEWHAAFNRFRTHVLPVAARSAEALTDGPQLLWRLTLSAPNDVELPWEPVHRTALAQMNRQADIYVELHNMLALAGSGDYQTLYDWAWAQRDTRVTRRKLFIHRFVIALMAYIEGRHQQALTIFSGLVPRMAEMGGSQAQNDLFDMITHSCRQ